MRTIRIYKSGIHLGEEKLLVGNDQSGMIYFSGCHLACSFCYTPETSVHQIGDDLLQTHFSELLDELITRGARNINLISPTHIWSTISRPIENLKSRFGTRVPLLLKVSGYETNRMISAMSKHTDIFIPDYKLYSPSLATQHNLPSNYGDVAQAAIARMMKTHAESKYNDSGKMVRGILVRHLMMPDAIDESLLVIKKLKEVGYQGHINFMTYFIDPKSKQLFNANPAQLSICIQAAQEADMQVLVNGKTIFTTLQSIKVKLETGEIYASA